MRRRRYKEPKEVKTCVMRMDEEEVRGVLSGYRKTVIRAKVPEGIGIGSWIVMYMDDMVVGEFNVYEVKRLKVDEARWRYGLSKEELAGYEDEDGSVAVFEVGDVVVYSRMVSLEKIKEEMEGFEAPEDYVYVDRWRLSPRKSEYRSRYIVRHEDGFIA